MQRNTTFQVLNFLNLGTVYVGLGHMTALGRNGFLVPATQLRSGSSSVALEKCLSHKVNVCASG